MSETSAAAPVCRNCGAAATGRYCPSCGQETKLALPSAREFLREAAGRYVALDGRLWRSLFALLVRPGFLTCEYFAGRRRRYVRPARLFLVLSLALFATLRLVADPSSVVPVEAPKQMSDDAKGRPSFGARADADDVKVDLGEITSWSPELAKRLQRFRQLSREEKIDQLYAGVLRYGPYAMLALLPAFALLLQIVYVGRRRRYPQRPRRYAQHLVFAAHNHAFVCLAAIIAIALPVQGTRVVLVLWTLAYLAWSMHAVYGGRWSGVLARGFVVAFAYGLLFAFATAALFGVAALLR